MKTPKRGPVRRERLDCAGNAALLVVVDSGAAYWEYAAVEPAILRALDHFGMPYRILDLAAERPVPETWNGCAGVLLAQNHLGERLTTPETAALIEAVRNGVGLVNCDHDLALYPAAFLEMLGVERLHPMPAATNLLRIRETPHFITGMQNPGEVHTFDRMVSATIVESRRPDVVSLAEGVLGKDQLVMLRHHVPWSAFEPGHFPAVLAAQCGKGRLVQFTLNSRVWLRDFLGHARGLDDLFWRSILWTARKPFAANLIPPFVAMSFDDCSGRHDFAFVDIARKHGFIPMPSLSLRQVPKRLFPKIRDGLQSGRALYNTHCLDYYTLLTFEFGRGEYSDQRIKEIFAFEDAWWAEVGARPGVTVRMHWGEYGVKGLPYLKERGRLFFCPARQHSVAKTDRYDSTDGFRPYGLQNCFYDYLPDDNDFFAFVAMLARHREDFLTGSTPFLRESDRTDVEKAAQSAAHCIRHGHRAGFFGELLNHEQKFESVSMEEWDRILTRFHQLTASLEKIPLSHDDIGRYIKGKDGVRVSDARAENGAWHGALAGTTSVPLRLSVFRDDGDTVSRDYMAVQPFDGRAEFG